MDLTEAVYPGGSNGLSSRVTGGADEGRKGTARVTLRYPFPYANRSIY